MRETHLTGRAYRQSCYIRSCVLSCQAAARGVTRGLGDKAVMCHPLVPTAWPLVGPGQILGINTPCTGWLEDCPDEKSNDCFQLQCLDQFNQVLGVKCPYNVVIFTLFFQ